MPSLLEQHELVNESELQDKVEEAVVIAAWAINAETAPPLGNLPQRRAWAAAALANPGQEARRMLRAVLAANKNASKEQIIDATDEAIQGQVDAAVDLFAGS